MKKSVQKQDAGSVSEKSFFSVSCLRLYILSVLSLGLYELYWMFKNWQCVKANKVVPADEKIKPVWRGWVFFLIWAVPLLRRLAAYGKGTATMSANMLAIGYVFCRLLTLFCWNQAMVFLIVWLFGPLFLLLFQHQVNQRTEKRQGVLRGEVLSVVAGMILCAVLPIVSYVSRWSTVLDMNEPQQRSFFAASGIIYRYSTAYNHACAEQGQPLDAYLSIFHKTFAEEEGVVGHILQKSGLTFDDFMDVMLSEQDKAEAVETVNQDLETIRRIFILQMLKDNEQSMEEQQEWRDEYNDYLSVRETCELINTQAESVIKFMQVKRLLKTYMNDI